jgi:hypothetical protein
MRSGSGSWSDFAVTKRWIGQKTYLRSYKRLFERLIITFICKYWSISLPGSRSMWAKSMRIRIDNIGYRYYKSSWISPLYSRFSQAAGSSCHKADDIFQHGDCLKKVDKIVFIPLPLPCTAWISWSISAPGPNTAAKIQNLISQSCMTRDPLGQL